jgi:two-component system, OmpR family, heavy metal sensor histidine kinase CusS
MSARLTVYYTISSIVLLAAAAAFLYWGLERDIDQGQRDYLRQKTEILTEILQEHPFDRSAVDQEVREEAAVSSGSRSPFFLRVLDEQGVLVTESPGMASILPVAEFPSSDTIPLQQRRWRSVNMKYFLLASVIVHAPAPVSMHWHVQAALDVSRSAVLLGNYRRDIALVLVFGLMVAAALGAWITRRGLRPIADITRATERIGARQLRDRIKTGPWPTELVSLAAAFDGMLDRLQEAFQQLSQFSADLAHELRNPINNLMGEAQVALSRDRTGEEYARVLQSGLEEHGRLARMIDSMLFLAQGDQRRFQLASVPLDGRTELQAVADFYQALAEEQGVELVCEGQNRIIADPLLLRRALSNLLSNALKYTSRGGCVRLRAAEGPGTSQTLSVIDSGVGIASEHLAKLGDRFYRVDPSRTDSPSGAGLGLAIVKSIMTLHGGSLLIESIVGQGTTVSLVFRAPAPLSAEFI